MVVEWAKWNKIINEHFVPLTQCFDRYVILYGSRGSSKSDYVSKQLILIALVTRILSVFFTVKRTTRFRNQAMKQ